MKNLNLKLKTVCLDSNGKRDKNFMLTIALIKYLLALGIRVELSHELHNSLSKVKNKEAKSLILSCGQISEASEILIVLGGDGSILNAAHRLFKFNLPILGINIGSLGFFAAIQLPELLEKLLEVLQGNYQIAERMMLDVEVFSKEHISKYKAFAINDVVLQRLASSRLALYELMLDGDSIQLIPADGIVIASPSGSTAYALACGGPIVSPKLNVFVITSICPHSLLNRSYVCDEKTVIKLMQQDARAKVDIVIDGSIIHGMQKGDYAIITKHADVLKFVEISPKNFYASLPAKLSARTIVNRDLNNETRLLNKAIEDLKI